MQRRESVPWLVVRKKFQLHNKFREMISSPNIYCCWSLSLNAHKRRCEPWFGWQTLILFSVRGSLLSKDRPSVTNPPTAFSCHDRLHYLALPASLQRSRRYSLGRELESWHSSVWINSAIMLHQTCIVQPDINLNKFKIHLKTQSYHNFEIQYRNSQYIFWGGIPIPISYHSSPPLCECRLDLFLYK